MKYDTKSSSDDPAQWHQDRRGILTATDLARLAHGGPAVWAEVKAEKAGHQSFHGNQYTEHGTRREPVIAEWARDELGMIHNRNLLVSTIDPRIGATPDLLPNDDSLVGDIKTAKAPKWDAPPQNYIDQVLIQMFVTGAEGGYLVVEFHENFIPTDMEPTVYIVDRDGDRIDELLGLADQFLSMDEPSILDMYLADYARGHNLEKSGKAEKAAAKELIEKDVLARNSFTKHVAPGIGSISLSKDSVKQSIVFDEQAFRAENPDLWAKYTVETETVKKGGVTITPAKDAA